MVAGEYFHDGSFARAVRPEETKNLIPAQRKRNIPYSLEIPVFFAEILYLYHDVNLNNLTKLNQHIQ